MGVPSGGGLVVTLRQAGRPDEESIPVTVERPEKGLDERIRRARDRRDGTQTRTVSHGGVGFAMRIGVELVAALVVGVGLGYLADRWLGTLPLLSLLGFLFGAAAGMLNVYRVSTGQGSAIGFGRRRGEGPDGGQ